MSLNKAVTSAQRSMGKKGVRSIEIEKAKGGYVTTTRHHDYMKPSEMGVHKTVASVAAHIKASFPKSKDDGDDDE